MRWWLVLILASIFLQANFVLATDINSCTNITSSGYYSFNQSIIANIASRCINITANDTIIDGNGYNFTGDNSLGGSGIYAESLNNITVKNINFTNFYTSVLFQGIQNSSISNVNISNNTGYGIYFLQGSSNNSLLDISSYGNLIGVKLFINANDNIFERFTSLRDSSTFQITVASGNVLKYNNAFGRINFSALTSSFDGNITFPGTINISNNFVYVNSTAVSGLNISANVTLYNVPTNLANYSILKDGIACSDCHNFTALNSGNVTFNVSSWSNYTVYGVDTSYPNITVVSPTAQTYTSTTVLINFSGSDDIAVDSLWYYDGSSNVTYSTPVNITVAEGAHNFIFYVNDTFGNLNFTSVSFSVDLPTVDSSGSSGGVCTTNWTCSAWSVCSDGIQTRNCNKIKSACYASLKSKPAQNQTCIVVDNSNQNNSSEQDDESIVEENKGFFARIWEAIVNFFRQLFS